MFALDPGNSLDIGVLEFGFQPGLPAAVPLATLKPLFSECGTHTAGISIRKLQSEEPVCQQNRKELDFAVGAIVRKAAKAAGGECFAVLEGGYDHDVLGHNVAALTEGLSL